jgi:hypothetical protein
MHQVMLLDCMPQSYRTGCTAPRACSSCCWMLLLRYSHMTAGQSLGFAGGSNFAGVLAHALQEQLQRTSCRDSRGHVCVS